MREDRDQATEVGVPYPGFGRLITSTMKERGLRPEDLADYLEIHINRIRDYTNGNGRPANPQTLRRLTRILGMPASAFVIEGDLEEDRLAFQTEYEADKEASNSYIKYPKFQRLLKERMDEVGISQSELARQCGVSHTAIAKYLSGQTLPSNSEVRETLVNLLGVPDEELFSERHSRRRLAMSPSAVFGRRVREVEELDSVPEPKIRHMQFGPKFRHDSALSKRLHDELSEYIQFFSRRRSDVELVPYSKPIGPLFRYRPDLLVVSDRGIEFAIDIRSASFKTEFLAGIALNWKMGTQGKASLFSILLVQGHQVPTQHPENLESWTFLHPLDILKREQYIAGYAVVGDDLPAQTPYEIRLEHLKGLIAEKL